MDRFMNKIGLHGKSFIPMPISFVCSVPAIMALIWPWLNILLLLLTPSVNYAARPFITDDAETVGRHGFQIESGIEYSIKKGCKDNAAVKETETGSQTVLTYGIMDTFDIIAGFPYVWKEKKENGETNFKKDGLSDMTLEAKWRLYEREGLGISLKPGISLPSGDHRDGFGAGRVTYGVTFIFSKEHGPVSFHLNNGYKRKENRTDERKDLLSSSFAITCKAIKNLTLGGDIGILQNTDPKTKTGPAFFLLGGSHRFGKISVDGGIRMGLNRYEVDKAYTGGVTINFD